MSSRGNKLLSKRWRSLWHKNTNNTSKICKTKLLIFSLCCLKYTFTQNLWMSVFNVDIFISIQLSNKTLHIDKRCLTGILGFLRFSEHLKNERSFIQCLPLSLFKCKKLIISFYTDFIHGMARIIFPLKRTESQIFYVIYLQLFICPRIKPQRLDSWYLGT